MQSKYFELDIIHKKNNIIILPQEPNLVKTYFEGLKIHFLNRKCYQIKMNG